MINLLESNVAELDSNASPGSAVRHAMEHGMCLLLAYSVVVTYIILCIMLRHIILSENRYY